MKKLNLGCGESWKVYPEHQGVDIVDYGQKYVGDAVVIMNEMIAEGKKFGEIMANHFLEHFTQDQLKAVLNNVHKLLSKDGVFKLCVPHLKKEEAWVLSHYTFWNESTVKWLAREDAEKVYGFKRWLIIELVTNERGDIHATLKKYE